MNIQDSIIFFMEILGTIAFAASGAMVGIRKRMDIFGICVLGVVTAVGGGMTRDVILGKLPSALEKPVYVVVSVITSLAIFVLLERMRLRPRTLPVHTERAVHTAQRQL